ncbi:hypothetical protein [Streptomyces laculatispora]|uniref:hypothetical protein n=1 Tax=Streptomyces laculatispora TaxID=887464 RepID=UPI001A953D18|nr:hypothetical protein [Streptomyces laculatispora]MBO0918846.1 hypothetical protein [Streptomyces laculatispora]
MAESTRISRYCWNENPNGAGRCVLNHGHIGNHYDWYARPSWAGPCAEWPQEQPTT